MSIGAVLDEAWTLFTRFFLRFFLIALVVFAVDQPRLRAARRRRSRRDNDGAAVLLARLGLATAVVGATWLQGAFVYAVQDARDGTFDASIGAGLLPRVALDPCRYSRRRAARRPRDRSSASCC